jgi:hypothetical protein
MPKLLDLMKDKMNSFGEMPLPAEHNPQDALLTRNELLFVPRGAIIRGSTLLAAANDRCIADGFGIFHNTTRGKKFKFDDLMRSQMIRPFRYVVASWSC